MLTDIRDQALENFLVHLEDLNTKWAQGRLAEQPQVCIYCWATFEEGCSCQKPVFWPIHFALGRLRAILGYEGYDI